MALTIKTHRVVLFGLQWFPIDNGIHSSKIGDSSGVKFTLDINEGTVVLRIIGTPSLSSFFLYHRVITCVYEVIAAHRFEGVRCAHQKGVRARLHEYTYIILAIFFRRSFDDTHLYVLIRWVPREPLLLRQIGQAQVVY